MNGLNKILKKNKQDISKLLPGIGFYNERGRPRYDEPSNTIIVNSEDGSWVTDDTNETIYDDKLLRHELKHYFDATSPEFNESWMYGPRAESDTLLSINANYDPDLKKYYTSAMNKRLDADVELMINEWKNNIYPRDEEFQGYPTAPIPYAHGTLPKNKEDVYFLAQDMTYDDIRTLEGQAHAFENSNQQDAHILETLRQNLEFGGERTTALRNFMYDKKRNKPFAKGGGDLYQAGLGSWLKSGFDKHKDTIQKYADYASYVPVIGKAAGFVSAGIDGYDAYQAYQAGDMETYKKERNKALTTAAFSGTPGQYVKGAIKGGIQLAGKNIGKNVAKTTAHVTKTGIKDETKDAVDVDVDDVPPIIDTPIPTAANITDPRTVTASMGLETTRQNMLNDETTAILKQLENDWTLKDQEERQNVTSSQTIDAANFLENSKYSYTTLDNNNESKVFGTQNIDNPYTYISYVNKNQNSDTNKKYLNNVTLNHDISRLKEFGKEADLTFTTFEGKENWDNYNFSNFNDVVKMQKELVNNGYDIGNFNNEIVNRTIEPRYINKGVDAKFGSKTKKAWIDYQLNKLSLQNKNLMTASYYGNLTNTSDINWKFNKKASQGNTFNYSEASNKKYDQSERIAWIESIDGTMSKEDYEKTEEMFNFIDNAIPKLSSDMLVEIDHNWLGNTVYGMLKQGVPINLNKIDPNVLKYFDIDEENIKTDGKKLALVTAYNIINNYSKIKNYAETNVQDLDEEQIRNMATLRMGGKYSDRRPNQYTEDELVQYQIATANNLTQLLSGETPTNREKLLTTDAATEVMTNAQNALNIDILNSISESNRLNPENSNIENKKTASLGGEIKEPKYKGKYARYGYEFDNQWQAKKIYEQGGEIDLELEKKLLNKGWIKKRNKEVKKPDWSKIPPHIMINSINIKFMKKGGDYPDMATKIKIYDNYLNGVFDNMDNQDHKKKAKKIVDKLNRFYMYDARDNRQHVFDYMKSQLDKIKNK